MKLRFTIAVSTLCLALTGLPALAGDPQGVAGAIYTMTNDPAGNAVVAYERLADGSLRYEDLYPTGGLGSGGGLGNQGGVVLSDNGRWLLVVNAGSDEISVFAVSGSGLSLVDTAPSGGVLPVSIAIHNRLAYVVHAGGSVGDVDSIFGFRLAGDGTLHPVPGSDRSLGAPNTGPAQIGFSPDGRFLIVTEKATNYIDVFPVQKDGTTGPLVSNPSVGQTPFAFAFGKRDQLFVSEVSGGAQDAGAVSSYQLGSDGYLEILDGSIANTETAPCWLVVTKGGRYVFTTNTPDDSLSAYSVEFNGQLTLVDEDGRTGEPGPGTRPLDMDLSDDGRFLYTLNIGDDTISTFRVLPDGSLSHLEAVAGVAGANGLAAR